MQENAANENQWAQIGSINPNDRLFEQIFDNLPNPSALYSPDGSVVAMNRAAVDLMDGESCDLKGKPCQGSPLENSGQIRRVAHAIQAGNTRRYEDRIRVNGSCRSFVSDYIPVKNSANEAYLVQVHWNETKDKSDDDERKALDRRLRQMHKMEAVSTLAGGVAHQINNVLAVIIGSAELAIEDAGENMSVGTFLREILDAGLTGRDVVKQLLSLNGGVKENRKPVDCGHIVEDSIKLMRISIPGNVRLRQSIQDVPMMVNAAPTQLFQVMINLCKNALRAMKAKGGVLDVRLERVELDENDLKYDPLLDPGVYAKIRVRDTGCGIGPEIIDRIFDPFFSTGEKDSGSGMGLAAVYGIVRNHEGVIEVSSEIGKGTTFDVFLPVLVQKSAGGKIAAEILPGGKERILFVDDENALAVMQTKRLERLGYLVEATCDPEKALEMFKKDPKRFDLVITDMSMPRMNGDRLAVEMLKVEPETKIILCTGYSKKIDEEKSSALGVDAFLQKPVTSRAMAKIVREVLDAKRGGYHRPAAADR